MRCSRTSGEATVIEAELLSLGVANPTRARHDLRTLAAQLPLELRDPLAQLQTLGDRVGAAFTTTEPGRQHNDPALLDVGRVLIDRHGDQLLVALIIAAVGQSVGWDVAVVTSPIRALVASRTCGPPMALAIAHEGRLIDATDVAHEGDLYWCCPHEVADLIRVNMQPAVL